MNPSLEPFKTHEHAPRPQNSDFNDHNYMYTCIYKLCSLIIFLSQQYPLHIVTSFLLNIHITINIHNSFLYEQFLLLINSKTHELWFMLIQVEYLIVRLHVHVKTLPNVVLGMI